MPTTTNMNPFAEWKTRPPGYFPSIFGALPSIPIAPILPVFISDSLVLRFSANDNVLHCILLGPRNRILFYTRSSGSRTTFRNIENAVFAVVDFAPYAIVEVQGFTPRQPVRDWLHLTSDKRCDPIDPSPGVLRHSSHTFDSSRLLMLGDDVCMWRPIGSHIVLTSQDSTILGRITCSASDTAALEITRPALLSNLMYPCIVSATLFLSGRHID